MKLKLEEGRRFDAILRSIKVVSKNDFCNKLNSFLRNPPGTRVSIGINQYSALRATKDEGYLKYLTSARYNHPDGKPIAVIANVVLKMKSRRTPTTDLLLEVLFHCAEARLYLFGSKPGVVEKVIGHLNSRYKNKLRGQIVGCHH